MPNFQQLQQRQLTNKKGLFALFFMLPTVIYGKQIHCNLHVSAINLTSFINPTFLMIKYLKLLLSSNFRFIYTIRNFVFNS